VSTTGHLGKIAIFIVITGAILSGCAQYRVQSNKEVGYAKTIDRLAVWSAVGNVRELGATVLFHSESFDSYFVKALKRELEGNGIVTDVRTFSPETDTDDSLERFESELAPTMRLKIAPTRTKRFTYNGSTGVTQVVLDLSLFDIKNNRRVWRGELVIDNPGGGVFSWGAERAADLSSKIIETLRKDVLIGGGRATEKNPGKYPDETAQREDLSQSSSGKQVDKISELIPRIGQHNYVGPRESGWAVADNLDAVPIRSEGKDRYQHYLNLKSPKVFVAYRTGGWRFWSDDKDSIAKAAQFCSQQQNPCWIYAVDEFVVWNADEAKRIGKPEQIRLAQ